MNKALARRRTRRSGFPVRFLRAQPGEGKRPWALLAVGAFLLALVAFLSGARLGKGLSDFHRGMGFPTGIQEEEPRGSSFPPKTTAGESPPSSKTQVKITSPAKNNKEKDRQIPPDKQMVLEEKTSNRTEETASSAAGGTTAALSPKAKFTLQIAIFNNPEEARALVNQLRSKGYPAYQVPENSAAKEIWHRVRVGHFQSLQEARQFAVTFEKKEKIKTIIANL